ncbi:MULTISPECIES: TolC family protein [Olivibacter]|jgi:outer membrane protein TolC|uniref:Outer membrane efflux protein n=3 Tax=Sphingobacteriaceae TaxID=84566 RepID=F4C7H0_SPHS2|nr:MULTISPECIES: TolC family protein [Olivibacter]MCL4639364.1 TolC family protein [Olivibacter sp. UJ_SKK_5.1]MDX3914394.1 TolC family protein [Pseudosphingobacterium sp.]QEL02517.1 TolC family protein [Olivibacter sp. LS-1]
MLTQHAWTQQKLSLKEALELAINNYGSVKAKANYAKASFSSVEQAKRDYLPNLVLSAQQDYGTVNGQNGPLYGFGGYGVASSGLPLPNQNWNAAFGSLYLANVNWEFFSFGKAKERIKVAREVAERDNMDLQQELFNHQVKVSAAYLNLLAAQKLTLSYKKNLFRADTFRQVVVTRALNGLIAGVDSSLANAEVSNAKIALTKAKDFEQEQSNKLAQLMGIPPTEFTLDSFFISHVPAGMEQSTDSDIANHPTLRWYQSRINVGKEQKKYLKTLYYPSLSLVGIFQTRGSGFRSDYASNQQAFTQNYFDGIKPSRSNYLIGIGLTWNLTQPLRISKQVKGQTFTNQALTDEFELANQQIRAQLVLADTKIENALSNYREVPTQVKAASDAFLQKSVLYKNGLTNLVDVTQALYALIRAETDRDIAYNNVWQALLYKAAASGDFSLFVNKIEP